MNGLCGWIIALCKTWFPENTFGIIVLTHCLQVLHRLKEVELLEEGEEKGEKGEGENVLLSVLFRTDNRNGLRIFTGF